MNSKLRLERLKKAIGRGKNLISIFKRYLGDLSYRTILDVGCGYGGLTIEFAEYFKWVHAIDAADKEIKTAKKRIKEKKLKNISIAKDNALYIKSTRKKFDVIHLSGVFEWLRFGDLRLRSSQAQELFLSNIISFLKDDKSILYSGTENKLFPFFWLKDPHTGWPFLVLLPETVADKIFKFFKKENYVPKIYSYWSIRKIYKKYFKEIDFYVPIPHYQYVFSFARIDNKNEILKKCKYVLHNYELDIIQKITVWWIWFFTLFGLIKLFTPGFIIVAKGPILTNKLVKRK